MMAQEYVGRLGAMISRGCGMVKACERGLFGPFPVSASLRALIIVIGGSLLFQATFLPLRVDGNSMMPTFGPEEFLVANRWCYQFAKPQPGDVVAIQTSDRGVTILKRVLAVPGDRVQMVDGRVGVNDSWLNEPYADTEAGFSMPTQTLGLHEYWVVGDNRRVSEFGKVQRDHIVGKVF